MQFLFVQNMSTALDLEKHFLDCNMLYTPPLSERVDIKQYAKKVYSFAHKFEAWHFKDLLGLCAIYCNSKQNQSAFLTDLSVSQSVQGQGIGSKLLEMAISSLKSKSFTSLYLECSANNHVAIKVYRNQGFICDRIGSSLLTFKLTL